MQSGPEQVTFGDASAQQTFAQFGSAGTYVLVLSANDSELSGWDSVTIIVESENDDYQSIPLQSAITSVQPMTGIVLWTDSDYRDTDTIQLEYAYMAYNDIVNQKDQYEWSGVDSLLDLV